MWWTPAAAATLSVGVGHPYPTLQSAVVAAASGDRIEVHAGTYVEDVTLDRDLTVVGIGRPVLSPATGGPFVPTVRVSANVTLRGLEIRGDARTTTCVDVARGAYDLTVDRTVLAACSIALYTVQTSGTVDVRTSLFTENEVGLRAGQGQTQVSGSWFEGNRLGAGLEVGWVESSVFVRNELGLEIWDLEAQWVHRSVFCGNGPQGALIAYVADALGGGTAEFWNNRFYENDGLTSGGLSIESGGLGGLGAAWVHGNTFVDNTGRSAAHLFLEEVDAVVEDDVFASGGATPAVEFVPATGWTPTTLVGDRDLFWSNAGGDLGSSLSTADFGAGSMWGVDPMFTAFASDGACRDDLRPLPGSPLVDAGDPTLTDPDGSRRDVGWVRQRP